MPLMEECYYIVFKDYKFSDYNNSINASESTSNRDWEYEKLDFGAEALSFYSKNDNFDFLNSECLILFDSPNFIVDENLKKLMESGLYGSQFYPAVIRDKINNKIIKDDLWALNTFDTLDCLDIDRSEVYLPEDGSTHIGGIRVLPDVYSYRFNSKLMNEIAENERLIFQMGGATTNEIFIHEKLVNILKKMKVKGVNFFKVGDYKAGDEF
ncbi:imm11 family protein [Photobacterium nomapromontoriensis]|uniref:imm11 family protein n=1 Tax=Photobacterium nomapromontoriensis TaxID=2910237 RepID=UPI003D10596E